MHFSFLACRANNYLQVDNYKKETEKKNSSDNKKINFKWP